MHQEDDHIEMDWDNRRLCPDGTCVGTIGPDLTCRICGTPFDPNEDPLGSPEAPSSVSEHAPEMESEEEEQLSEEEDPGDEGEDGWEERELCPDGSCIGTLGDDGHCRVCGLHRDDEVD